jgi:transposase
MKTAPSFHLPKGLPDAKQVPYCISIIERYQKEILPLRAQVVQCHQFHDPLLETLKEWKKRYEEAKEENTKLREEKRKLEKETEKLKQEIEKITKTNNRFRIALFDHGNFTHPEMKNKKKKGGQNGHTDTNRETTVDYVTYQRTRLFAKTCGNCGGELSRVRATRQKILVDISINPEIVQMIIDSERQWCGSCKKEVVAKEERSLPFTEYGINTFMVCMLLRFKAHASFRTIVAVMRISHGLTLSPSEIANILSSAAKSLTGRYETLKKAIQQGAVMYQDETGWLIHGQKAWMWIMVSEHETVYLAGQSRGKGIAEELYSSSTAYCMTDGLKSYTNVIPKEKHLYCWAHILRFSFEETIHSTKDSQAVYLREELVRIYHLKKTHPEYSAKVLEDVLTSELTKLLSLTSQEESCQNIHRRVKEQKDGLIKALLVTPDGTNNLAERELRNMAIKRTISHGSDTYQGMETTAIIGSVLQTLQRDKQVVFLPTLRSLLVQGIQKQHPQYVHTSFHDV